MNTYSLKIDFRMVSVGLLVIIGIILAIWQPWNKPSDHKTITLTGQGTLTTAPDEFTFTPYYQKKDPDQIVAKKQASEVGDEVVTKLKSLGLKDTDITTNLSVNEDYAKGVLTVPTQPAADGYVATFTLTAKAHTKETAQKILDYLITTPALYSISPQSGVSETKRAELELEARKKALANAKQKADLTAKELNLTLGKVKSVSDLTQTGGIIPIEGKGVASSPQTTDDLSMKLETGQQDISFSLTVVYELN